MGIFACLSFKVKLMEHMLIHCILFWKQMNSTTKSWTFLGDSACPGSKLPAQNMGGGRPCWSLVVIAVQTSADYNICNIFAGRSTYWRPLFPDDQRSTTPGRVRSLSTCPLVPDNQNNHQTRRWGQLSGGQARGYTTQSILLRKWDKPHKLYPLSRF